MSLYSTAVEAIRTAAEQRQAELDSAAAAARQNTIAELRRLAVEGVPEDSTARAVCELVAHSVTVGRESDGYPEMRVPQEVAAVVWAAVDARIIKTHDNRAIVGRLKIYKCGGIYEDMPEKQRDFLAWNEAREFRKSQTWAKL